METGFGLGGGRIGPYLTAYPASVGGAAKDQLRGRREFVDKAGDRVLYFAPTPLYEGR